MSDRSIGMLMKEKIFNQHKDFIDRVYTDKRKGDLAIVAVAIEKAVEVAEPQLEFFRNGFYEISLAKDVFNFEFAVDGKKYMPEGYPFIAFFAPGQLQSYNANQISTEASGFFIYFSKAVYQNIVAQNGKTPFFQREYESYHQLTSEEFTELAYWAKLMIVEAKEEHPRINLLLTSLLNIFLIKANTILKVTKSAYASRPEEIVDHFLSLLAQREEHQSVQQYADELALTPKQLNRILKQVLNKSASKVIQESTIEKAKALILQSNLSFTEIAYRLGFDELSNFSRLFKRVTNCSPNQFRLQGKK